MRRVHTAAALAGGLVCLAIVASPISAGEPPTTGTITVGPTSGHPRTEFVFSGEGCVSDTGPGVVDLAVLLGEDLVVEERPDLVPVEDDGSWTIGIVPNGFVPEAEAVGLWDVTATCFDAEKEQARVDYEVATFEVTARPTPPTTAPPTTTSTTTTTSPTRVARRQPSITVSPSTAAQGDTVTISGNVPITGSTSCASGDLVRLTSITDLFPPDGFGPQVPRDADGNFDTTYAIPTDTPPGTYGIGMRCGGGNVGISATLQATRPAVAL
jgi:hypothetical protein